MSGAAEPVSLMLHVLNVSAPYHTQPLMTVVERTHFATLCTIFCLMSNMKITSQYLLFRVLSKVVGLV